MEYACRFQTAVLWPADGHDPYGQPKVGCPEEITVRWVSKSRQATDANGNPITLDATVIVVQDVDPGSAMWLGTLEDWYGTGSAGQESGVMEVVTFDKTPDIKNRAIRRELGLRFYKDTLPNM
jgi:hypothetical protein